MTRRAAALSLAALTALAACARPAPTPPPSPGADALARLHRALVDGADVTTAADLTLLPRAELLAQFALMHELQSGHGEEAVGATEVGWRRALDDLSAHATPPLARRALEPMIPLLGNGRCALRARLPLPPALDPVAAPAPSWPAFVDAEVRAPLARRAARATASRWRCEGAAGDVDVVLAPRGVDDVTPVVVRVTPAAGAAPVVHSPAR